MPNSTYMSLPIPTVGVTTGTQWALNVNTCLTLIDQHDHSPGYGNRITPAGMNITSTLDMQGNSLTNLKTSGLQDQVSPLSGASYPGYLYRAGVNLYYNDGSGNQIQITSGGGVAGTPGSIANLVAPASASYVAASQKFVWQSATNTAAKMDVGDLLIREVAASANAITLKSPTSLAGAYNLTLFPALPAAANLVTVDNTGALATFGATFSGSNMTVPGSLTATTTLVATTTVTAGTQVNPTGASNVALTSPNSKTLSVGGKYAVTSNTNAGTNGLAIVRGVLSVTSDNTGSITGASTTSGEGFSISTTSSYVLVTFTSAFSDIPAASVTVDGNSLGSSYWGALRGSSSTSSIRVGIFSFPTGSGTQTTVIHFIAVGQRS